MSLAFVVRLVVAHELLAADPLFKAPVLDDRAYLDIARAAAEGRAGDSFLAPLYPWTLAQVARYLPLGMALACGINVVVGAAASGMAWAAARVLHSDAAALVAGVMYALFGAFVFQDVSPGQETLLTLLHLTALYLAIQLVRPAHRGRTLIGFGLCVGLAMLGRATSIALALLAVPFLIRCERMERTRLGCVAVLGLLVVVVPAALRNFSVTGDLTPLPWSGGPNLYAANGPDSRETISFYAAELPGDPSSMARRAAEIARADSGRQLTPGGVSSWWTQRTWRERGSFAGMSLHFVRKAALFWSADERGSNHSVLAERDYSWWLRSAPVCAWPLLALGAAAWWLLRARSPVVDGVALTVLGTCLLLAVVFPVARYRLPVAAMAVVLVAGAAVDVARRAQSKARIAGAAGALAVSALVAFLPIRESAEGEGYVNLARAHFLQGDDPARVEDCLNRALAVEPACGPAHELLGRMLFERGDAVAAFEHFVTAAQDRRTRWTAQVASLPALVALRRLDEALSASRGLLRERRDDPELLANAALVVAASGDRAGAAGLLAEARRLAPDHPAVRRASMSTGL